jgi:hypothetical protein
LAGAKAPTTLYSFEGGTDGSEPRGGVINVGGILYGTTSEAARIVPA